MNPNYDKQPLINQILAETAIGVSKDNPSIHLDFWQFTQRNKRENAIHIRNSLVRQEIHHNLNIGKNKLNGK